MHRPLHRPLHRILVRPEARPVARPLDRTSHRFLLGLAGAAAVVASAAGCSQNATPASSSASVASSGSSAPTGSSSVSSSTTTASKETSTTVGEDEGSTSTTRKGSSTGSSELPASVTLVDGEPMLIAGPITYVALGDSLTAGDGDDSGRGYVGLIEEQINAFPGREGSTVLNLGRSGWDSQMMVNGQEDENGQQTEPSQLAPAVEAVKKALADGRPALATILIGSNDLWYTYEYGPESGSGETEEDAALETYRANLERAVTELQEAGAFVVIGLPDDQSIRPAVADISRLNEMLPSTTAAEVTRMSALAKRFDEVASEIAAAHRAPTVNTDDPFWASASSMADDGIHPNAAGYEVLAARFMDATDDAISRTP